MQQHLFQHLQSSRKTSFIEDICIALVDKTDPLIPTNGEEYWRNTLKAIAPQDINNKESAHIIFGNFIQILVTRLF